MIMNELLHLQYHDYLHLQYDLILRIRSSISNSIENVYQYVTSIFKIQLYEEIRILHYCYWILHYCTMYSPIMPKRIKMLEGKMKEGKMYVSLSVSCSCYVLLIFIRILLKYQYINFDGSDRAMVMDYLIVIIIIIWCMCFVLIDFLGFNSKYCSSNFF